MGNRAVVLFQDADRAIQPFAVYFHLAGQEAAEETAKATFTKHSDRRDDVSYFAARFVGEACAEREGSTGVGLLAAPDAETFKNTAAMEKYSRGGAGVCVCVPSDGTLTWIEGTGYGKGTKTY